MNTNEELLPLIIRELNKEQKMKITSELIRRCRHFEEMADTSKEEIAKLGYHEWWIFHYDVLSAWNMELARALQAKISPLTVVT